MLDGNKWHEDKCSSVVREIESWGLEERALTFIYILANTSLRK